jgi:hypothetical protein
MFLGSAANTGRVWEFLDKWGLINFQAKDGPPRGEVTGATLFELAPTGSWPLARVLLLRFSG